MAQFTRHAPELDDGGLLTTVADYEPKIKILFPSYLREE